METPDYLNLPSIKDIAESRLHLISRRIILGRMNGASLRDIALEEGLSRSDSRQIEREALDKLFTDYAVFMEDHYKYLYEHYSIDDDFFLSLNNGVSILYYLKNRYKSGFGNANRAIEDKNISEDIKAELKEFYKIDKKSDIDIVDNEVTATASAEETTVSITPTVYDSKQLPDQILEKIDELWLTFITCGFTKPIELLEQVSFFLILKKLDDEELKNYAESIANGLPQKPLYFDSMHQNCRWSMFHNLDSHELYSILTREAVPFIRNELHVDTNITVAKFIKNVHLKIKDATLLLKIVSCIDSITSRSHISLAAIYDCLLTKAGFSRDISDFLYKQLECTIEDSICCPYMDNLLDISSLAIEARTDFSELLDKVWNRSHFNNDMFFSYMPDNSLLLISSLRMFLNEIPSSFYANMDIVSDECSDRYTRVVASIPLSSATKKGEVRTSVRSVVNSSNASLTSMYACHEILAPGGICGLLIPHRIMSEKTAAYARLREFYIINVAISAILYLPKENKDLFIYKNTTPSANDIRFAKIEDYSIESIEDLCSMVSLDTIRNNKFSFDYTEYFEAISETNDCGDIEDYPTLLNRIYSTESKIDSSIDRIKRLTEELL